MVDITDTNLIYEAYLSSIKGSKWKYSSQKFRDNALFEIRSIQHDLQTNSYKTGPKSKFIINERGKIRHITTNTVRDRVVRHLICDYVLMPQVEKDLIYSNCASRNNKGIDEQRRILRKHLHTYFRQNGNKGYVLLVDFSKYYDNINHKIAYKQLLRYCHTKIERSVVKEILYSMSKTGRGVDIGDQLSQVIGIRYPILIDNRMTIVEGQHFYGRYMDDIYLICKTKEECQQMLEIITDLANQLEIAINFKKTTIQRIDRPFHFLQNSYYLTESGRLVERINKKKLQRMRKKLRGLARLVDSGERDLNDVKDMFRSWMGTNYRRMSEQQIYNMDKLYYDLFIRRKDKTTWMTKSSLLS